MKVTLYTEEKTQELVELIQRLALAEPEFEDKAFKRFEELTKTRMENITIYVRGEAKDRVYRRENFMEAMRRLYFRKYSLKRWREDLEAMRHETA